MNIAPPKDVKETTGIPAKLMAHVGRDSAVIQRPLAHVWITDDMIVETQRVWSAYLERPVPEDEAIEMLINLRRLADALAKADQE